MNCKRLITILAGVLCAATISLSGSHAKALNLFTHDANTSTELVDVQIGNYDYRFPANYFWSKNEASPNCNHETMSFLGTLTPFEGKTQENYNTIFRTTGPDNPSFDILMSTRGTAPEPSVPLPSWLESRLGIYKKTWGPHKKSELNKFGLRWLKADAPDDPYDPRVTYRARDIFYTRENGKLSRVIICDRPNGAPNPGCEHSFLINDAAIKISYRLKFLADWKTIENNARAFFTKATIAPVDTKKPACRG